MVVTRNKSIGNVQDIGLVQDAVGLGATPANHIAKLIDEIGAMLPAVEFKQTQIRALAKELAPYAEKMKALVALVSGIEGHAADETFKLQGAAFAAVIGKRCTVRTVTDPKLAVKLLNKVDKGLAWAIITVPLGKVDQYLRPTEKLQVLTVDRGDRPVTIIKKVASLL